MNPRHLLLAGALTAPAAAEVMVEEPGTREASSEEDFDAHDAIQGADYTGDPGDTGTWEAAGADDVYIDINHPVERIRQFEEVVTNYVITSPLPLPSLAFTATERLPSPSGIAVTWDPPIGTSWEVETSRDLDQFEVASAVVLLPGRPPALCHLPRPQ